MKKCCQEVLGGGCSEFNGGGGRHGDLGRVPGKGVGHTFGRGFVDVNPVAPIVFLRRASIPSFNGMRRPRFTIVGFHVHEDPCTRRSERCAVIIEGAMDLGVCGKSWIDARGAEEV